MSDLLCVSKAIFHESDASMQLPHPKDSEIVCALQAGCGSRKLQLLSTFEAHHSLGFGWSHWPFQSKKEGELAGSKSCLRSPHLDVECVVEVAVVVEDAVVLVVVVEEDTVVVPVVV